MLAMSGYGHSHFEQENGREYHSFRAGQYMYPCDDVEKDRLDMFHAMFTVARHGILHSAPLNPNNPTRVLDLGTGTGIWAIEMAERYPNAEIIGTDLADIQPSATSKTRQALPNVRFQICDFESEWTLGRNSFDLIHLRSALGSVSDWDTMWRRVFEHLKPGTGHLEYVELDPYPRSDDGVMNPHCNLLTWVRNLENATSMAGKPIRFDNSVEERLRRTGFVDIHRQRIILPLCDWSREKHMRGLGRWYSTALIQGKAIEALSYGPFTRVLRWPKEDVDDMVEKVAADVKNKSMMAYCILHVITARRPHRQ